MCLLSAGVKNMRRRYLGALAAVLLLAAAGPATAGPILAEHFDNVAALAGAGWASVNNSAPLGSTDWFQGNAGVFPAYDGAPDAYVAANFLNAGFGGNIDNWGMTPELPLGLGGNVVFYTRSTGAGFADRLQVRMSSAGASTNVADFTTLLLDINPALDAFGYPSDWTRFSVAIPGGAGNGRIAFRYLVPDTSVNGDYIGIDNLRVPEPTTLGLLGLGALALRLRRRGH
jgi:hypothetical protein